MHVYAILCVCTYIRTSIQAHLLFAVKSQNTHRLASLETCASYKPYKEDPHHNSRWHVRTYVSTYSCTWACVIVYVQANVNT